MTLSHATYAVFILSVHAAFNSVGSSISLAPHLPSYNVSLREAFKSVVDGPGEYLGPPFFFHVQDEYDCIRKHLFSMLLYVETSK